MSSERINNLARLSKAKRYLEIGVLQGDTFLKVEIDHKTAVDPLFQFDFAAKASHDTEFYQVSSDEFFRVYRGEPFDIIFLDGLHTFEQTLRDFLNSLTFAHRRTIWLFDDTVPNDNFSALPDQERCYRLRQDLGNSDKFWMGDVFKVVFFISGLMKYYQYFTFLGHGQTAVWRDLSAVNERTSLPLSVIAQMSYEDFREYYKLVMNSASDDQIFAAIAKFLE